MGKKTIKVPYTDKIEISSMFCQDNHALMNIYGNDDALTKEDLLIGDLWGCIIRPLEHSNDGYFFYRKDLGNGEMLVCGECYPMYNHANYQEAKYYLDEDHEPNTCFFVEEDSLTDDDEFDPTVREEIVKDNKLQQGLQKLETSKPITTSEPRVYIVDVTQCNMIGRSTSDEEFMTEAEKQGTVYSLQKFEDAFNYDDIDSSNSLMRII